MIQILNDQLDPRYNLALEEFLTREMDPHEDYLLLWQNRPMAVVGRYQNTAEEINQLYVKEHHIMVVRRLSGGGSIYQDLGNLNFSMIVSIEQNAFNDFRSFTLPIIQALDEFGVKAELSSRNDLTVDGRKFSGNAQYRTGTRLLHHGTLLFDSDLDVVGQALNVRQDKIASKGIKSVRSRVTNLKPYLPPGTTLQDFSNMIAKHIGQANGGISAQYRLS
ncbi:MAG: lipoate--protein ligase, partial [Firmicutes bacterium]|nr:lipoate--protein ligase [Bacillota bacterium]